MTLLMLDFQIIENIINIYIMKIVDVKNLEIVPPKNESGSYETAPDMPKMHQVCVIVGKRAAGKSVAAINLIEKMGFDYSIVVSPTMASNKELMATKAAKAEARDKSLNPVDHWSTKPATVEKSRSDDTRMRNYGDD